jgi:small subunit ribosomal protein S8
MYTNFLIKLKNAAAAKKEFLKSPYSKFDYDLAELLRRHGFLKRVGVKGRTAKRVIEVELNLNRPIEGLRFLSKPSRRLYAGYRDLKPSKGGAGVIAVTTSRGVMDAREARRQKIGGQLLFEIW